MPQYMGLIVVIYQNFRILSKLNNYIRTVFLALFNWSKIIFHR